MSGETAKSVETAERAEGTENADTSATATTTEAAAASSSSIALKKEKPGKNKIFQFHIRLAVLEGTPRVWRRVQLYADASFWDLHCAIQNAFGWEDTHLHCFEVKNLRNGRSVRIGKPLDEKNFWSADESTLIGLMSQVHLMPLWKKKFPRPDMSDAYASWKAKLSKYFSTDNDYVTDYTYDFGDNWIHRVVLEGVLDPMPDQSYPVCVGGQRMGPPEDTGNIGEYKKLLATLKKKPEHRKAEEREKIEWLNQRCPNYDPEKFDPSSVVFIDAKEWLKFKKENTLGRKIYREVSDDLKIMQVTEPPKEN